MFSVRRRMRAGARQLVWRPGRDIEPRTYLLRLTVGGRVYTNLPGRRAVAPVVRVQGIEAGFPRRSYAPGEQADLRIATDARDLRLQVFQYTSQVGPRGRRLQGRRHGDDRPVRVDWSAHRHRPAPLRFIRAGDWPSGLYFLRLSAHGRPGRLRAVRRPHARLRASRVARRPLDQHLAGVQLLGRQRRRLGRQLVRERARTAPSISRGRSSTSACRSASATGISTSSRG